MTDQLNVFSGKPYPPVLCFHADTGRPCDCPTAFALRELFQYTYYHRYITAQAEEKGVFGNHPPTFAIIAVHLILPAGTSTDIACTYLIEMLAICICTILQGFIFFKSFSVHDTKLSNILCIFSTYFLDTILLAD